jgi:hypothetical protein
MITYIQDSNQNNATALTVSKQLPPEVEKYAQQFLTFAKASTENTISMCELLNNAKIELKQKENNQKNELFNALCKSIGYSKGANDPTIKKFVRIGECANRFRPYIDKLPNSWTTLYEITQLDNGLFEHAIENGAINIKMIGREVKSLKQINQPQIEKKVEVIAKKPAVLITLENDADKTIIDAFLKELEVLKFSYKFELSANDVAQNILKNT